MTPDMETKALELMIGAARYRYPIDRARFSLALRAARSQKAKDYVRGHIRAGMRATLNEMTVSQRRWQTSISKRPNKAKKRPLGQKDDLSRIKTREHYVTCNPA